MCVCVCSTVPPPSRAVHVCVPLYHHPHGPYLDIPSQLLAATRQLLAATRQLLAATRQLLAATRQLLAATRQLLAATR